MTSCRALTEFPSLCFECVMFAFGEDVYQHCGLCYPNISSFHLNSQKEGFTTSFLPFTKSQKKRKREKEEELPEATYECARSPFDLWFLLSTKLFITDPLKIMPEWIYLESGGTAAAIGRIRLSCSQRTVNISNSIQFHGIIVWWLLYVRSTNKPKSLPTN